MAKKGLKTQNIPYGAVYLVDRDLTLKQKRKDLENMKKMNFNTVVLWPSMSRWDAKRPGNAAFKSIDEVMDLCAELGIGAVLELQGQNISNQEAPENHYHHDGKPQLNNPTYRALTCTYMHEVAAHFKGHPALVAYDIYNEIGYFSQDTHTRKEFSRFLEKRYKGNLDKLNKMWGTYFDTFADIADMEPPYNAQYRVWLSGIPERDWQEFRPHNWELRLQEWTAAIREIDEEVIILADALGSDSIHNRALPYFGATDWQIADNVEMLGLSCWANMLGPNWRQTDVFQWPQFWRYAVSAARGKQVMVSELMTQNRTMFPTEGSSMTDQMKLWSYQIIFNGVKGIIYWKYRPFRNGVQVAGRGLTDFEANINKHGEQTAEVAAFTARHTDELADAVPDSAGVAVLHDHNVQNIYAAIHKGNDGFYTDAVSGMWRGLWTNGISPEFVRPQDLGSTVPKRIKVLVIPCNVSLSKKTANAIAKFLKNGGTLLTESRFGLLNEDATLWDRVPGGGLSELSGIKEADFTCLYESTLKAGKQSMAFTKDYFQYLKLDKKVKVLQTTDAGDPALLKTKVGKGTWVHVPYILSHKVQAGVDGSLDMFKEAYAQVAPSAKPAVPVLSKDACVDVSVLLDKQGEPFMIGVSNYEHKATKVQVGWKNDATAVEGAADAKTTVKDGVMTISVPARDCAAVFI